MPKVENLLSIMSLRLEMVDSKLITPHAHVIDETRQLLSRLNGLDPLAEVDIEIVNRSPLRARYILVQSGEILAMIDETQCV